MKNTKILTRKERNSMIHAYILDRIDSTDYGVQCNTDRERITFLMNTFKKEYGFMIERIGECKAFKEWVMGLPTCFSIEFENYEICKLGLKWGLLKAHPRPTRNTIKGGIFDGITERAYNQFVDAYWNSLYMNVKAIERK